MALTPHPSRWTALLDVAGPDGHRSSLPFRPPRVRVGRRRGNDLALPDQGVSSSHCEFTVEDGWFVVRDLASINGTFVNDRRVSEARLADGDVVRLGGTSIRIALHGELRGPSRFSLSTPRRRRILLGAVLGLVALGAGLLAWQLRARAVEGELRGRYAALVRELLQADPCALVSSRIAQLGQLQAQIGARQIHLAAPGQRQLPLAERQATVELLGLYRQRAEVSGQGLQALALEQQEERNAAERITRLGARFSLAKDRRVARFVEGQLAERLGPGDALVAGLQAIAQESQRFAELVEAVALKQEPARVPELTAFRFSANAPPTLLRSCQEALARTNAGTAGAVSGFDDE